MYVQHLSPDGLQKWQAEILCCASEEGGQGGKAIVWRW